MTINGPGESSLTVSGNNAVTVFDITVVTATVSISGVTIYNGKNASADGGGILNAGALTLTNSVVFSNTAGSNAGGIYTSGMLTLYNVTVVSNTAAGSSGGGIRNDGTAMLTNVTLISNTVPSGGGGGLANLGSATLMSVTVRSNTAAGAGGIFTQGPMTITQSSIISNIAPNDGGGIGNSGLLTITKSAIISNTTTGGAGGGVANNNGSLSMINVTLSGNAAPLFYGGGLVHYNGGASTLTNVTLANNSASGGFAGAGITNQASAVTLKNTIVAYNAGGSDCQGIITSAGHNLDSADTCGFTMTGDITNTNPFLGPPREQRRDHADTRAPAGQPCDQRGRQQWLSRNRPARRGAPAHGGEPVRHRRI